MELFRKALEPEKGFKYNTQIGDRLRYTTVPFNKNIIFDWKQAEFHDLKSCVSSFTKLEVSEKKEKDNLLTFVIEKVAISNDFNMKDCTKGFLYIFIFDEVKNNVVTKQLNCLFK